jgi:hypothetical protein
MYEAAASCKDNARAPITNWEPQSVTLAGYCYAVGHGRKVQLVTPYRVSHLQRYGVTVRGEVAGVYPPLKLRRIVTLNLLADCGHTVAVAADTRYISMTTFTSHKTS